MNYDILRILNRETPGFVPLRHLRGTLELPSGQLLIDLEVLEQADEVVVVCPQSRKDQFAVAEKGFVLLRSRYNRLAEMRDFGNLTLPFLEKYYQKEFLKFLKDPRRNPLRLADVSDA